MTSTDVLDSIPFSHPHLNTTHHRWTIKIMSLRKWYFSKNTKHSQILLQHAIHSSNAMTNKYDFFFAMHCNERNEKEMKFERIFLFLLHFNMCWKNIFLIQHFNEFLYIFMKNMSIMKSLSMQKKNTISFLDMKWIAWASSYKLLTAFVKHGI